MSWKSPPVSNEKSEIGKFCEANQLRDPLESLDLKSCEKGYFSLNISEITQENLNAWQRSTDFSIAGKFSFTD